MGSGYRAFATAEVLTAANVNNYLMTQSVMYFATTAARDTAITSPVDGMVAYIGSNDSSEGLYTYNGTSWRLGSWNMPWGAVAAASIITKNNTVSGVFANVPGLTVTFTSVNRRKYEIILNCQLYSTVDSDRFDVRITDGSGTIIKSSYNTVTAGVGNVLALHTNLTSVTSGSFTVKVTFARAGGSGTCSLGFADGEVPSTLTVKDIGPSGAPV